MTGSGVVTVTGNGVVTGNGAVTGNGVVSDGVVSTENYCINLRRAPVVYRDKQRKLTVQEITITEADLQGMPMTPFFQLAKMEAQVCLNVHQITSYELPVRSDDESCLDPGIKVEMEDRSEYNLATLPYTKQWLDDHFDVKPVLQLSNGRLMQLYITRPITQARVVGVCGGMAVLDLDDCGVYPDVVVAAPTAESALDVVRSLMRRRGQKKCK